MYNTGLHCLVLKRHIFVIIFIIITTLIIYNIGITKIKAQNTDKVKFIESLQIRAEKVGTNLDTKSIPYVIPFETEESKFLFNFEANEDFFPNGLKGDNINGYNEYIVPNIIHYVIWDKNEINFAHYISIKSVLNVQKPDLILIHGNIRDLTGKYYNKLNDEYKYLGEKLKVIYGDKPSTVYGIKFSKDFHLWHASDVTRIKILLKFGGIYLDRDMYVIKSLDKYRKYETTIDFQYDISDPPPMSNSILIACKGSRFMKLYLQTYQKYDPKQWFFNGGLFPTEIIINRFPHLVHKLHGELGVNNVNICQMLYLENRNDWSDKYDAMHLFMRGYTIEAAVRGCLHQRRPAVIDFDENIVKSLKTTFGQMARLVLYNTSDLFNN